MIGKVLRIPGMVLRSPLNGSHGHWGTRSRERRRVRGVVEIMLRHQRPPVPSGRLTVTFTRIGPARLDDDNLAASCKGCRDAVAAYCGTDDGSDRYAWRYRQRAEGRGVYAVEIEIRARGEEDGRDG